jgi:steroid delta-isomerase-like uncharacterized protein
VNKHVVRQWIEDGFAAGNLASADELVAHDFVNHTPQPGQQPGREGLKQAVSLLRSSFSDLAVSVHDMLAEGDLVAARDEIQGVHVGAFAGVPATGARVSVRRIAFYRLANGQISEHWAQLDTIGLLQQLGAAPGQPAAGDGHAVVGTGPADANKRLIRHFFEDGLSQGNMTLVDDLVASSLKLHGAPPDLPPGREGLKALLGVFRTAFPDYRDTLDEMVADGDRVATRWTFRGTHLGQFQGIAPTNKPVTIRGMSIFRVSEGQIVEDWTEMDILGLLQQIGPAPG